MDHMRKSTVAIAAVVCCCLVLLAGDVLAQTQLRNREFLNLGANEPYLNYGRKEYDPYPQVLPARNKYDRMGNFLVRGFDVFNWEFSRPGYSEIDTRTAQYLGWFNNLVILSDSYRGWNYRVTLGEDINSKLSDLTFRDPRFYGIQLDGASSDNKFTLLMSQGGDQLNIPKFTTFKTTKERSSVLIFGGHWETKLGSLLRLGATYYNQHMANTFDEKGSFIKGDTPYSMLSPSFIEVVIEDDSPNRPAITATVYDVDVVVTGTSQGQAVRLTSVAGDQNYDPSLEPIIVMGALNADGGYQVAGHGDQVVFRFQMPDTILPDPAIFANDPEASLGGISIESVRFVADVSGDYRIGVRQEHLFFDDVVFQKNIDKERVPGDRSYINPFTGLKGDDAELTPDEAREAGNDIFRKWPVRPELTTSQVNPFLQYKWDQQYPEKVSYTVVRSKGQNSKRHSVTFDYSVPTGQALYGLDWDLNVSGFKIKGEFATNPQYFIYPVGSNAGKRDEKRSWAYFVNAEREVGPLKLGAEWFRLDPDYSGNYDSRRGGIPFFADQCVTCPQMQEMNIMADNDDNDQYPDEFNNERPSADKRDSGVFPGLDENNDLVPDSDQNLNGIADWTEPILFYDADPPEFVYGIDFNNNGVVDFRENDGLPDYPYRRDRKGYHLFVFKDKLGAWADWLSVGRYSMKEPAGGNKANAVYLRYENRISSPFFGTIKINNDIKWVEDSITDDVYVWKDVGDRVRIPSPYPHLTGANIEARDLNTQLLPPDPDPLSMRNSLVNTMFIESRFTQISGLNIVNNFQWIRNGQQKDNFADGTAQIDGVESRITMVNKADYTINAGNLSVRPMFKHLFLRRHSDALKEETGKGSIESFSIFTPIIRTRLDLTPKSNLQLGVQGLPFWRHRRLDRVDDMEDWKEWNLVFMLSNRSDHYGFNVASQFGFIKTNREFTDASREGDNFDSTRIFFDIVSGF